MFASSKLSDQVIKPMKGAPLEVLGFGWPFEGGREREFLLDFTLFRIMFVSNNKLASFGPIIPPFKSSLKICHTPLDESPCRTVTKCLLGSLFFVLLLL